MSFATLTLDFGRESVAVEPRYVMAFHPTWIASSESPDDPAAGHLVTRIFFATGMQLDVVEAFEDVSARLLAVGWG